MIIIVFEGNVLEAAILLIFANR